MANDPDALRAVVMALSKKMEKLEMDVDSLDKQVEASAKENSGGYSMKALSTMVDKMDKRVSDLEKSAKKK